MLKNRLFEEAGSEAPSGATPPSAPASVAAPTAAPEAPLTAAPDADLSTSFKDIWDEPEAAAPPPVVPPVIPPAPVAVVPPAQVAAPVAPVAPVAPQVPVAQQPLTTGPTPAQEFATRREAAVNELTKAYGQFTDEEVSLLMTEPHRVLGSLAARVVMDAFTYTTQTAAAMIPGIVQGVLEFNRQDEIARNMFYGSYAHLKGHPQAEAAIQRIGAAYVEANPNSDTNQRIRDIGALVCHSLGLPLTAAPAAPAPPKPPPASVPFLPPPVPAGIGGAAVAPSHLPAMPWDDILN